MKKWDWKNLNLYTSFMDILRNFWVILLAGIIGFFGCFSYYSYVKPVEYVSQMTVAINLNGYTENYTSYSLSRTVAIAEILTDVFNSDTLKNLVNKEMEGSLEGSISATQMEETNLVTVKVTSSKPMKAYKGLQMVFDNYEQVTDYVFHNTIISTLKEPSIPTTPTNATRYFSRSIMLALFMMALICCLIIIISYYRFTLKDAHDVEQHLDTRLFGTVSHEKIKIKKAKDVHPLLMLNTPFTTYDFSENFRKMAIKLESLKRTKHINSIMVTSVAENEGKTTAAVNLAAALSLEGNKVLLIDVDLKKPSAHYFFRKIEHNAENELNAYFQGKKTFEQILKQDPSTGVYFLGGKRSSHDSSEILNSQQFKTLLREMEDSFDFVILDTPPSGYAVDAEIVSGLVSCAVLVARQDYTDVAEIQDYLSVLSDNTFVVGCLLNDIHRLGSQKSNPPC